MYSLEYKRGSGKRNEELSRSAMNLTIGAVKKYIIIYNR